MGASRSAVSAGRDQATTGGAFTAPELARMILERTERESIEQAIAKLAKTIQNSFSRQKHLVVTYDQASTWPN